MTSAPNIVVYHLITVPQAPTDEVAQASLAWAQDHVARSRYTFASDGTELLSTHPLFSRLAGFACAELQLIGREFELTDVQVTVGNERQCLELARAAHAEPAKFLMHYSPWAWFARYLIARSTAMHTRDGTMPPSLMGRAIDLADMVSLGGLVGVPPLHLALEALDIPPIPRPLPATAVEKLLSTREHGPICRELIASIWGSAALYTRWHFGKAFSVRRPSVPTDGAPPAAIGEPSTEQH